MKVIYKYLNKFKEPIYISLVLLSIIIIIKLFKKKIIEGHEEHSFSKLAEKGCDQPLNWENSEVNELINKIIEIRKKTYDISSYRQMFAAALQDGKIIWNDAIVITYLQSDNIDAPEHMLIEVDYGLYDLILDYAHEYEKKKTKLTNSGKWRSIEKSNMLPNPKQIMDLMLAAELDVGYIQFESYKSATPTLKKIIPEESYKQTFRINKQNRWNSRKTRFVSDEKQPWNDSDKWRTSAYVKYSNSTGGAGASYNTACEVTGEPDDCQMCDMNEQIECYKRKWNEFKTKANEKELELQTFQAELNVLKQTPLPDFDAQVDAISKDSQNKVSSCNTLSGYGDPGNSSHTTNTRLSAEATGREWCPSKMDMAGNNCRFNKAQKKPGNKPDQKYKIYCV